MEFLFITGSIVLVFLIIGVLYLFSIRPLKVDEVMDIDKEPLHQTKYTDKTLIEEQRCIVKTLISCAPMFVFTNIKNENDEALRMVVSKCLITDDETICEIKITLESGGVVVMEQHPLKDTDLIVERIMYFYDKYSIYFNRSKNDIIGI